MSRTRETGLHGLVSGVGERGLTALETTGRLILLAGETVSAAAGDIVTRRFSWAEFLHQVWFMARVAFLPTILVSIPFGVIVAVQIGGISAQIGASSMQGAVNGVGVLRQGAPLVTSLMIAGVVGSAITADLGARTVREEIDALKVMGLSPIRRLVAPRLVAGLAVAIVLTAVVATTSILTSFALVVGGGKVSAGTYLGGFASFAQLTDLALAMFKALVFAFIAILVAAQKGLNAHGGPKGVADGVNQSVVLSVILLAVVNVAITQAYVMLVPQRIA
ncbi:MlaE family ABC transporter permease [Nocardioides jiangxiensis]|uniref:ABC transporter permease n=1 Tax=Nocardioides jiangxiensis TaxID=3064524 RepID=A0ABT9AYT6_9ACTN|nr:ABC transporter permease [Nocardioides sp. WY-20]MDO7867255.1 ABC transporter permease [Nocardioides sp. WY-20]